jgi:glycosyltransferase involved in cell wall biosynthesis
MLLSIVVLSYNRPRQIKRILEKLVGVTSSNFNLIIKDDASPLRTQILKIVNSYSDRLNFEVVFYSNKKNMGYDRNLIDSFSVANSDYVFLLSDDDYILGENLDELLSVLALNEHDFYFTPYHDGSRTRRIPAAYYKLCHFSDVIYNSILFSGLVFKVSAVNALKINYDFLSNCIYSQVYLASSLAYKRKAYGVLPSGILYLGGDGYNFFGKNESAKNANLLSDRKNIAADLTYQQFLLKTIDQISNDLDSEIGNSFYKEYKKRLIAYGAKARGLGLVTYFSFLRSYFFSTNRRFFVPSILFMFITVIPSGLATKIYDAGVKVFRKSG